MTVIDLSRTGLKLRLQDDRHLKPGDRLLVAFQLDDLKGSEIRKEVVVRKVDGREIGLEFASQDPSDPNMKAIGFYLFG